MPQLAVDWQTKPYPIWRLCKFDLGAVPMAATRPKVPTGTHLLRCQPHYTCPSFLAPRYSKPLKHAQPIPNVLARGHATFHSHVPRTGSTQGTYAGQMMEVFRVKGICEPSYNRLVPRHSEWVVGLGWGGGHRSGADIYERDPVK